MKYFWTFFWTFALIQMATFVGSSMAGVNYEFGTSAALGVIATVLVLIVPYILPEDTSEKETVH